MNTLNSYTKLRKSHVRLPSAKKGNASHAEAIPSSILKKRAESKRLHVSDIVNTVENDEDQKYEEKDLEELKKLVDE